MCNAKPGKRCSTHALEHLNAARVFLEAAEIHLKHQWDSDPSLKDRPFSVASALAAFPQDEPFIRQREAAVEQATVNYYETAAGRMEAYARYNELVVHQRTQSEKDESRRLGRQLQQAELQAGVRDSLKSLMDIKTFQADQLAQEVVDDDRRTHLDAAMDTLAIGRSPRQELNQLISLRSKYTRSLAHLKGEREAATKRLDEDVEKGRINYDALDDWTETAEVTAVATKEHDYITARIESKRAALIANAD